ncbi:MAG: hypothetical protein AB7O84_08170 [Planctomycetota bacterium]
MTTELLTVRQHVEKRPSTVHRAVLAKARAILGRIRCHGFDPLTWEVEDVLQEAWLRIWQRAQDPRSAEWLDRPVSEEEFWRIYGGFVRNIGREVNRRALCRLRIWTAAIGDDLKICYSATDWAAEREQFHAHPGHDHELFTERDDPC